jgi:hypothetical protein
VRTPDGWSPAKLALASGVSSVVLFAVWFMLLANDDYFWLLPVGTGIAAVLLGCSAAKRGKRPALGRFIAIFAALLGLLILAWFSWIFANSGE